VGEAAPAAGVCHLGEGLVGLSVRDGAWTLLPSVGPDPRRLSTIQQAG
jgi:hypothetical protein